MAKPLRPKRGTTAKNDAFVGMVGEITVDTEEHSIRVHDGVTAGGYTLLPNCLPVSGGTMQGDIGMNGRSINDIASIEMTPNEGQGHGGFIDFHFNGSGADYTSRIIEEQEGLLAVGATKGVTINGCNVITSAGGTFNSGAKLKFTQCGNIENTDGDTIAYGADRASDGTFGAFISLCHGNNQGVPGGALIYTRYADGTLGPSLKMSRDGTLEWDGNTVIYGSQSTESSGSGYALQCVRFSNSVQIVFGWITTGTTVTFPLPFKTSPSIQLTHFDVANYSQITSVAQPIDGASMVGRAYNVQGYLVATQVGIWAIGHWK